MEDPTSLSDKEPSFQDNSDLNKNQEYLVMTVEIGDGRTDIIAIHENDDPSLLAQEFASKHNLDLSLQKSLSKLIRQNKELVEKKNSIDAEIENWSDWPGSNYQSQNLNKYDSFTPKINEKSRKIIAKCERQGNVYERLYQKGKKPIETKEQIKTMDMTNKSKSAANNINYGEWLYVRGMKMKEAAKKSTEDKKKEQVENDSKELTFSPTINKISSLMSPRYYEKPEDILYKKAEMTKQKIESMRQKLEEEKFKECSFTPVINSGPRTRETDKSIHENLYNQAEKTKEKMLIKRENEIRQYSFTPNVGLTKKKDAESHEPVYERLLSSRKKFEDDLEEVRKAKVLEFDENTGQKLFKPVIESKVEPRDKPIWEILYNKNSETRKERESLLDEENRFWEANASAQKTTENTQKIFADFKEKQYEKLFKIMDSDKDGKISANAISLDGLDMRTIELLKPIFENIEETREEIDFKGFLDRIEIVSKLMNVGDRAYLIKRESRPQTEQANKERVPYVSPTSAKMAEKKRADLPGSMYDRLVAANSLADMRIKKHKELNQMFELKDCTFKPNLTKH
ncbi:hypothetical protein SteCoe_34392 [Stentor coeruleus]|uniref:PFU domain-containing protein n=1 Tax=Stentor coeruleus TaxID=5963 RepID=A0A1R2AUN4_9CILI|nr:hypothetical protein SteCoe_34392 [Stentor coeruleus]